MTEFGNQFNSIERTPEDGQDLAKPSGRMMDSSIWQMVVGGVRLVTHGECPGGLKVML